MAELAAGVVATEGLNDVNRQGELAVLTFKRPGGADPLPVSVPVPELLDLALNALRLEKARAPGRPGVEQSLKAVNLAGFALSGEADGALVLSLEPGTGGCLNVRFDLAMARSLRDALDAALRSGPTS